MSINNANVSLGLAVVSGTYGLFTHQNGTFSSLSSVTVSGAGTTIPCGINDLNQIVGYYDVSGGTYGFTFQGGTFTTLNNTAFASTVLSGINNQGHIAGYCTDSHGNMTGVTYDGMSFGNLNMPNGDVFQILAINDKDHMVGQTYISSTGYGVVAKNAPDPS